jgi:hypothetical protein
MSTAILVGKAGTSEFIGNGGVAFVFASAYVWGDGWSVYLSSRAPAGQRHGPGDESLNIECKRPGMAGKVESGLDALAWLDSPAGAAWRAEFDAVVAGIGGGGE